MTNINIRSLESRLINNSNKTNSNKTAEGKKNFNQILEDISNNNSDIKFSKHAKERLDSRNINLENEDMDRLNEAFDKAKDKGVKEALILMDNQAFIANVSNKTVITAMGKESLKENVFTNIDGAVII